MDNNPFLYDLDASIIRNVASQAFDQKIQHDIDNNLSGSKDLEKINQRLDVIKTNSNYDYESVAQDLEMTAGNLIRR